MKTHVPIDACVLELGGHVGLASVAVARRLADATRHLVLEIDPATADTLRDTRDSLGLCFRIEACGIAARPLLMEVCSRPRERGSAVSGREAPGREWWPARRVGWPELCAKHPDLHFDALVVDCDALADIVADYPGFLTGFHTVLCLAGPDDTLLEREGFAPVGHSGAHRAWTRDRAHVQAQPAAPHSRGS